MKNSLAGKPFGAVAFVLLALLVAASWASVPRAFAVPYESEQLTNNSYSDGRPQINDAGQVVWRGWDGSDYEVFLYDPTDGSTTPLTQQLLRRRFPPD